MQTASGSNIHRRPTLKTIITVFLLSLAASGSCQHVVVVSVDGLRPVMYQANCGRTPNLQQLMRCGVYADHLLSVFPAYTYPSHTAMLTGALPARSGITHNVKDGQGHWFWYLTDVKVKTLWQAAGEKGLTMAAIQWPVSAGKDVTYNIPEIWDTQHPSDRITETRKYATPGLIEEIEQNATGELDSINMSEAHFSLDLNAAKMAGYIFKKYKPNLTAVHFALVDGMEHAYGIDHDSVRLAMENADHAIGIILNAIDSSGLKDSTTVLVVGDHGFSDIHEVLRPNLLLKGMRAKFIAAGGSAFLYGDAHATGQVINILDSLPATQRKLFKVLGRNKLDSMGADSSALLALAAVPGVVFSGADKGAFTGEVKGGHHGYDPELPDMHTGFIAAGAGIRQGGSTRELRVTDIAAIIARLLHLDFYPPDGRLPEGILQQ